MTSVPWVPCAVTHRRAYPSGSASLCLIIAWLMSFYLGSPQYPPPPTAGVTLVWTLSDRTASTPLNCRFFLSSIARLPNWAGVPSPELVRSVHAQGPFALHQAAGGTLLEGLGLYGCNPASLPPGRGLLTNLSLFICETHGNVCHIRELGNMCDAPDIVGTLQTLDDHPFSTLLPGRIST